MKKIIETDECDGLESLLGEHVTLWGTNYVYSGTLVGVDDQHAKLTNAHVVYETGALNTPGLKDAQPLPGDCWFVRREAIESFGAWGLVC